ncbi:hypothetical protein [Nocardioides sp.]|uniref:hypothetical protein n=1 Tax=Nocardioides sp. TaxID=35761 RepID=UPI003D109EDE
MPSAARAVLVPVLVAAGAWTAVCVIALNTRWWGLPVAVAATVLAAFALPAGWLRGGFTLGWVTVLGLALVGRPEGDWAIVSDWRGYTMLATGLFVLTYAVGTIPRRARKPENPSLPT